MTSLYDKALAFAVKAHAGQKRKFTGEEFISHPVAVAAMIEGEDAKVVALLHDVVKDTDVTPDDLRAEGFSPEVVGVVDTLTKFSREDYEDYIYQLSCCALASRIKIADLKHNLLTLPEGHSLEKRYHAALKVLEEVKELEVTDG